MQRLQRPDISSAVSAARDSSQRGQIQMSVVNSLLETNLGMPYVYCIFVSWTAKVTEQLKPRQQKLSFVERIAENNRERVGMPV